AAGGGELVWVRGSGGWWTIRWDQFGAVAGGWGGGYLGFVPAGAGGLQVGQARRPDPEEPGAVAGLEGPASPVAIAGADAAGSGHDRGALGPEGPLALPESDPELPAGLVQVLRIVGPAAAEQRSGTHLRRP